MTTVFKLPQYDLYLNFVFYACSSLFFNFDIYETGKEHKIEVLNFLTYQNKLTIINLENLHMDEAL